MVLSILPTSAFESKQNTLKYQDDLEAGFKNPSREVRPQTWFHVMSSNMSKEGITKDLESLAEVGVGGTQVFHVTQDIPIGDLKFNSQEHIELLGHFAKESQRFGLRFGLHNTDGWTASGGPWVTPEYSQKRVVHSITHSKGGQINTTLTQPDTVLGYYRDIAVLAYPALSGELIDATIAIPKITSSNNSKNLALLIDGNTEVRVPIEGDKKFSESWVQYEYDKPIELRFVEMRAEGPGGAAIKLDVSNDGVNYKQHAALNTVWSTKFGRAITEEVEPVKAKYIRLNFPKHMDISELSFSALPRINQYMTQTLESHKRYQELNPIKMPSKDNVIDPKSIIDLTKSMDKNGQLTAELPKGQWSIMRVGFTTMNSKNEPASKEGQGLEVDKFSKEAIRIHYDAFSKRVIDQAKAIGVTDKTLFSLLLDSYEVGAQGWTDDLEILFEARFGYSLKPYLPLLTGRFVGNQQDVESVLWDFRKLTSDLMRDNYFKEFTRLATADGLLTYAEAYGNGAFSELDAAGVVDVPMGEFWTQRKHRVHTAVSTGHIYNQKVISTEAFTTQKHINFNFHLGYAKGDGDLMWTLGVNEFIFHRFAHQSNTHVMPGMSMGGWGANLDRTQTWWKSAGKAWFKYMARGQSLLQQGQPVADVLFFTGDGAPTKCNEKLKTQKLIPVKINFDCINPDVLLNRVTVKNKQLVLPQGTTYKALMLESDSPIAPETIDKLSELANAGVVIVGPKPRVVIGKMLTSQQRQAYKKRINQIWNKPSTYIDKDWDKIYADNGFKFDLTVQGKPNLVYTHRQIDGADVYFFYNDEKETKTFEATFDVDGKVPELWYPLDGSTKTLGQFTHTEQKQTVAPIALNAGESVFVVFRKSSEGVAYLPYIKSNKDLELMISPENELQLTIAKNGKHKVKLASGDTKQVSVDSLPADLTVQGNWSVQFNPFYGYGETVQFDSLVDWKDHPNQEIQDYSGDATYTLSVNLSAEWLQAQQSVILDLGQVSIASDVTINGQDFGTLWATPYQVDVSKALKVGQNELKFNVYNTWVNRLIADKSLPDTSGYEKANAYYGVNNPMVDWYKKNQPQPKTDRVTFVVRPWYKGNEPRVTSGLLGPVTLSAQQSLVIK